MTRRWLLIGCLVFSGMAALVYQIVWTRLLGLSFGTTTEAIGTVLAVFFGGLALGNLLAARTLDRIRRPLRVYAWLELGIGAFALASLPLLLRLDDVFAWVGADHGPWAMTAIRAGVAAVVLLPPTAAMGATLPVVARGLVEQDATLGRWSAWLYTANTFGAVLGAYLCGFWAIPQLGLTHTVWTASAVNLGVAALVLLGAGGLRSAPALAAAPSNLVESAAPARGRGWFLLFFGISGFVAIGYEIVWSKIFSIVMEGTLYGFAAVLSTYLLGIGLGSLAVSRWVDRVRDLPRLFGLLHLAIGASVALGMFCVPLLPFAFQSLARWAGSEDAVHLLLLLVAPLILVPTALFGAAFPVLIRIYARRADRVGQGMGVATAVNTAGSIASSLLVGFVWIPELGIDASLYLLLMIDLGVGFLVVLAFRDEGGARRLTTGGAGLLLAAVALSYNGVRVEQAVAGRWLAAPTLALYRAGLGQATDETEWIAEGRTSIVTVHENAWGRRLRTNGMPEAGRRFSAPHFSLESQLLGALPYLLAEEPHRALAIGYGGGATVSALAQTDVETIRVVELEERVIEAARLLHPAQEDPQRDPRVEVRINDGRNELLMERYRDAPRWDLISSQPSHPWLMGAANLFTEEYFDLIRERLTRGGVFALWVNGFRTDPESVLAILTSFERILPGGVVLAGGGSDARSSLLLLGGRKPLVWDLDRMSERLAEPALAARLEQHGVRSVAQLLARAEGPVDVFARLEPTAANTDDNAFIETRVPRRLAWENLEFAAIETRVAPDAPLLPPVRGSADVTEVARAILELPAGPGAWPYAAKLDRLLRVHGAAAPAHERVLLAAMGALRDPARANAGVEALRKLAARAPDDPEPLRQLGLHWGARTREYAAAAAAFEAAWQRSGAARDAYDAARSWHHLDPERAWQWAARVGAAERHHFPRLALYDAERALAEGAPPEALEIRYRDLLAYRATDAGRGLPGVDATLASLADALGLTTAARGFRDADRELRQSSVEPLLQQARRELGAGNPDAAEQRVNEARALVPGYRPTLELAAEIAAQRRDRSAFEEVLDSAARWAPTRAAGISTQIRWRERWDWQPVAPASRG